MIDLFFPLTACFSRVEHVVLASTVYLFPSAFQINLRGLTYHRLPTQGISRIKLSLQGTDNVLNFGRPAKKHFNLADVSHMLYLMRALRLMYRSFLASWLDLSLPFAALSTTQHRILTASPLLPPSQSSAPALPLHYAYTQFSFYYIFQSLGIYQAVQLFLCILCERKVNNIHQISSVLLNHCTPCRPT